MNAGKIYYHGTTAPNLKNFELGIKNVGECTDPVRGIWLSEYIDGARWHAGRASNIRKTKFGFVYQVTLGPCTLVADATQSSLPAALYENYKATKPLLKRLFLKNNFWYWRFDTDANLKLRKKYELPDEISRDNIINICSSIGMDGILNPLVIVHKNGSTVGLNEPMYGKSLLLLNMQKVLSIKLVDTI